MFTGSTLGLTNTCPLSKHQWLGLLVGVSFPKTCPVADPLAKLLLSNLDTTGVISLWAEWSQTQTLLSNWGNKWGRYTQRSDKNVKPPCYVSYTSSLPGLHFSKEQYIGCSIVDRFDIDWSHSVIIARQTLMWRMWLDICPVMTRLKISRMIDCCDQRILLV